MEKLKFITEHQIEISDKKLNKEMDFSTYNTKKVAKYIRAEIDAECESALPGGGIFGKAIINLKDTMKSVQIQLHGFSAFLIMKSESSKCPNSSNNFQKLIMENDLGKMTGGKKLIDIETNIPQDAFSSLEIQGHDFGEYRSKLFIKGVITGSYLVKKSSEEKKLDEEELAANNAQNNPGAEKKDDAALPADGEKKKEGAEIKAADEKKDESKINLNSERKSKVNKNERDSNVHKQQFFVITFKSEIEVDNDTDGEKVFLERPVQRAFITKSGGCCGCMCKSKTNVRVRGRVLNTNIRSLSDDIKFFCTVDMAGNNGHLKQLVVLTCFGVTPVDNPKPDLTIWKALSINRYFPDKTMKEADFDTTNNISYIQQEGDEKNTLQMGLHYVSNHTKNRTKANHFFFPHPTSKRPFNLHSRIKIGRQNGLGTFYSNNKRFKTCYAVKIYPVIKGSEQNGKDGTFNKIGEHLTIPISVKARLPPSAEDKKIIEQMYNGLDYEKYVSREKFGKMRTMVNPAMGVDPMLRMKQHIKQEGIDKGVASFNQVAPAGENDNLKSKDSSRSQVNAQKTPIESQMIKTQKEPVTTPAENLGKMEAILDDGDANTEQQQDALPEIGDTQN